jgi:hypothetical protein
MRYPLILKLCLPVLLCAQLLTACGTDRPAVQLPPAEWTEPVAFPAVPEGEAVCDGKPCLSDRESANLMADLANALDQANAKLQRIADWRSMMAKK